MESQLAHPEVRATINTAEASIIIFMVFSIGTNEYNPFQVTGCPYPR